VLPIITYKSGQLASDIFSIDPQNDLNFAFDLQLPVFSSNLDNFDFSLAETSSIKISTSIQLENVKLTITKAAISLDASAQVTLSQSAPITFDIDGQLDGTGEVSLTGDMQGIFMGDAH
jgi:hypothetical protein